ncbi:MAG TPA: ATP-binding protein, partial [Candidatus Saccharimonas sp.]|nr:ATP-binding protein [Candidatus Saccharimonas sp.]
NLQNSSLSSLGINFMLFYNDQQQLVLEKAVDTVSGADITMPPELPAAFKPGSSLLARTTTSDRRGFLATASGPVFLVAKPILRSDGEGPVRGTLVFAEYLSPAEITKLANLTHLTLNYYPLSNTLPDDAEAVRAQATADVSTAVVRPLSSSRIAGYRVVADVYGRPLLMARVELPRDAFQEAGRTLGFYLIVVLIVTLMAIVVAIYTTNQIVSRDRTIQLKNEFFSIASHELRTPLAAIRGNSQMLGMYYGPKNDADLTRLTNDIHDSSVRLIKMVSNFLDAARLEQGKLPFAPRPMTLHDPINIVVKELEALAAEKHLTIKAEIPANLPHVMADPERVQQVVYNLAGNAMKFTETGGVTIRAVRSGHEVVVMVSDTGRGMTPEQQRLLFKKFQQARTADDVVGSGLGLYISKMLVERMGGRMWLESSVEDQGTTISFGLPVSHARTKATA